MRKDKITSDELARLCGVSQGTIDRALNNRPGISPKTKQKVLQMAKDHGFIKNQYASSLSRGHPI
ncbi:MAG: helix-turn-helix domain-containing protein [Clostridia bacterium]